MGSNAEGSNSEQKIIKPPALSEVTESQSQDVLTKGEWDYAPRFPGCEDLSVTEEEIENCAKSKLIRYIYSNLKYPATARENYTQGMVVITFVVYSNGEISDIYIEKEIGDGCGMAAVEVIQSFDDMEESWTPGRLNDKFVNCLYRLPVKFKLESN